MEVFEAEGIAGAGTASELGGCVINDNELSSGSDDSEPSIETSDVVAVISLVDAGAADPMEGTAVTTLLVEIGAADPVEDMAAGTVVDAVDPAVSV